MTTKEVGFSKKFESAQEIAKKAAGLPVRNPAEFAIAEQTLKTIRELEKELEAEYKAHPAILEATRLRGLKGDLATLLENARKGLKGGAMLRYEQAEEEKRLAEERRQQKIAQEAADKENARILAEQKKEYDRLEKIRKAAEKKGDDEAAAAAAAAAASVKEDAVAMKANPIVAAAVVIEKTAPTVSRRMVPKFRVFNESIIPKQYWSRDDVKIGGVIRSLRANHGIPGVEYYEEPA